MAAAIDRQKSTSRWERRAGLIREAAEEKVVQCYQVARTDVPSVDVVPVLHVVVHIKAGVHEMIGQEGLEHRIQAARQGFLSLIKVQVGALAPTCEA